MKKIIVTAFVGLFFLSILPAHPPSEIKAVLLPDSTICEISVLHKVSDPEKHFIEKIEIRQGKKLLKKWIFEKQDTAELKREEFNLVELGIRPGQKFQVIAYCNRVGKLSAEFSF